MTTPGGDPARHDGGLMNADPRRSRSHGRSTDEEGLKVNLHQLLARHDREGRERHAHHHRLAAAPAHRRRDRPAQAAAALAGRDEAALLLGPDRRAEDPVREEQGARPLLRREEPVALPRQHLHAARRRVGRVPLDPVQDPVASTSSGCRRSSPSSPTKPRGLVLVTGPTGSGKSTTLASIIDKINSETRQHIMTIEDPIEYLHPHKRCIVNQREVGTRHR